MTLEITKGNCKVHTDCQNEFYLESATCSTCGTKVYTDHEFNWSELPLSFYCHNCGENANVSEADAYSELRAW